MQRPKFCLGAIKRYMPGLIHIPWVILNRKDIHVDINFLKYEKM